MSTFVTIYDANGVGYKAKSQEEAQKAVDTGKFFFDKPDTSAFVELGLVPEKVERTSETSLGEIVILRPGGIPRHRLFEKKTGKEVVVHAADARELVSTGDYVVSRDFISNGKEDKKADKAEKKNGSNKKEEKSDETPAAPPAADLDTPSGDEGKTDEAAPANGGRSRSRSS